MKMEFAPFIDEPTRGHIAGGVDFHNVAATGVSDWFPVNLVLRGEHGDVLGGLLGELWGGWLHVSHLWVAEMARGAGHGSKLLGEAEAYARQQGGVGVSLDTYSFQARPYYERLGYEVFGQIADCPPGHTRYFMKKLLVADNAAKR